MSLSVSSSENNGIVIENNQLEIIIKGLVNLYDNYDKFDSMLKDTDEEYRTTLIDFSKYKLVMFAMGKLMEMETTEQNQVALYIFNSIKD